MASKALGEESSVLLHHREEMVRSAVVGEYHSFAAEGSHLGASEVEHFAQVLEVRYGDVSAFSLETVAHSGSVDEKGNGVITADRVDGFDFGL